jgi:hypothetical protein
LAQRKIDRPAAAANLPLQPSRIHLNNHDIVPVAELKFMQLPRVLYETLTAHKPVRLVLMHKPASAAERKRKLVCLLMHVRNVGKIALYSPQAHLRHLYFPNLYIWPA